LTLKAVIDGQQTSALVASVYMPVANTDTDQDFEFICGLLSALILDCDVNAFLFAGDFNFQFSSSRHDFFLNSLKHHTICSADNRYLNQDSFTYLSDCHNTTTWIDHVFPNVSLLPVFQDMSVSYGIVGSDHRSICFNISADVTSGQGSVECTPER